VLTFIKRTYVNERGAGPLSFEDVVSAGYSFAPGSQVWARQWNLEGGSNPKAVNDGGTIWGLGLKHESADTILENKNGGRAELWAGFAYTFGSDPQRPAYLNQNASLAVQTAGMTYMGANGYYNLLVKDIQGAATTELRRAARWCGRGAALRFDFQNRVVSDGEPQFQSTR